MRAQKLARHLHRAPEVFRCALHTPEWLSLTLRYAGLQQTGLPRVAQFRDGQSFEFCDLPDLATWWQIFYRRVYPVRSTDRIIIDAGANIGAFTLYALEHAPKSKVIAIEPFPMTFSRLSAAVERSPFGERAELVNAALRSGMGRVAMHDGEMPSQFRRVLGDDFLQKGTRQKVIGVDCCSLPEILARAEGEVDFLKMDIEGSEYACLLTSPPETLRQVRRIAMEFHPVDTPGGPQRDDLFQHLERAGFRATEIQDHGEGYGLAYLTRK